MKCPAKRFFVLFMLLGFVVVTTGASADILTTKHNLSTSGTGTIIATGEVRVCIFCHTPHHSTDDGTVDNLPLWNRTLSSAVYNLYGSSSLVATPGQPTGASRLCLSCHDGTIAIGMLQSAAAEVTMVGGVEEMPIGTSNLETDLSDDHPISFPYTAALASTRGELVDPGSLPAEVKLEDGQTLQCTSCHNPHKDPYGMFLVLSPDHSALCLACHDKTGWATSSHATDAAMEVEGCENCHQQHGAGGAEHLLQFAAEESNCLANCHNGTGDGVDIDDPITKMYNHPVDLTTGIHDVTEDPAAVLTKHVECVDCHNPHQANDQDAPLADPPNANGRLKGVAGVDSSAVATDEVDFEYEVCFKCHGGSNAFADAGILVPRVIQQQKQNLRFDPTNPSHHPVVDVGENPDVPNLRAGYTELSQIYCTDCHGSDDSVKAGGTGADGPHGSIYPHILLAEYQQDIYPLQPYSDADYALCFICHDPTLLFATGASVSSGTNFYKVQGANLINEHQSHVVAKGVACSVCHDPHGTTDHPYLINFDRRFTDDFNVSDPIQEPVFDPVGQSCTVSCHNFAGHIHNY